MLCLKFNIRIFILFLVSFSSAVYSQTDSLKSNNKTSFAPYILPLTLITVGSSISGSEFEKDIQTDIRSSGGNDFKFGIDDYIVYAPMVELYIFDWLGCKAKNNFFDRSKNIVLANLASVSIVRALKSLTSKTRPDGTDQLSFPSNHSNIAFTNATVLYHEYKDSNRFIAYSGFAFATTTGVFRMLNNKHWISDVLTGAGIGILVGNLVYRFEPLKNWHPFGLGAEDNITLLPQFGNDSYGICVIIDLIQ
ncbi:MAG: phosphatase PAP2 family protein [Candidatus Delongbacteria bacterium]|nr:phosphatase PAP2 family protein [Candidatus Delongbacteria bacterium]